MKKPITDEQIAEYIKDGIGVNKLRDQGYSVGMYRYNRVKAEMARKGWSPEHGLTREAAPGFVLKGHSDFVDEETGQVVRRWLKYDSDKQAQHEMMLAAIKGMSDEIPRALPVAMPLGTDSSLCNLYTLTDTHVGMLAWHREGGADWDLKIAEATLVGAFAAMMHGAPKAGTAVINQLGDMLHFDSLEAVTPTSHNLLDADGRYSKVVEAAIRILRKLIDMALSQHEKVHLVIAEGNHDLASSVWLRKMFAALYEHEPRLTVNDSELPYYVYQHGKTMLAFHHGHKKPNHSLPLLFASQYSAMWGATTKRYAHTGHRHHTEEKEHSGMTVVQHPTLSARDAHASRGGYIAERQAVCITYHSEHGKVASNHVSPEMLEGAA